MRTISYIASIEKGNHPYSFKRRVEIETEDMYIKVNLVQFRGSDDLFLSDRYQTQSSMARSDNAIESLYYRYGNVAFLTFVYLC